MQILRTKKEVKSVINTFKNNGKSIGFVPTMGALHEGHISLVRQSNQENDHTIVSIFVNPTQFDNAGDLDKYPRTLEDDAALIEKVDDAILVFAPQVDEIYSDDISSKNYSFDGLEHVMEGAHRDGHFDGVGTILEFLFNLLQPNNAYFGEKDYQQLLIVKKLVSKYHLDVNITGCAIYREASGLAMSSRNERLSTKGRIEAAFIYKTLQEAKTRFGIKSAGEVKKWVQKQFEKNTHLQLEYIEIANADTLKPLQRKRKDQKYRIFIAAFIDNIRLIDNLALN